MLSLLSRMARRRGPRIIALSVAFLVLPTMALWYAVGRPALVLGPETRQAVARGQDYLKEGRPNLALRAVAGVPEDGPWDAGVLAVRGMALAALDRPEDARPILERSLKLDPNQPMVAKVLAAIYFSAGETDRGLQMLDRAARLDPEDFRPWFASGDFSLRHLNRPANAVEAFREALRRRPGHAESRIGLIEALLALGRAAEATPLLEAALRDSPRDPKVLYLAARHANNQGQTEEVARFAEQALALDPDHVEALVLRGQCLHREGRHQEALSHAERAVTVDPNNIAALNLLAPTEHALGLKERSAATSARYRKVTERLEEIRRLIQEIKQHPDDPEFRLQLGQLAAEGGMKPLAIKSFRAALTMRPDCQPALQGLASLLGPPPEHGPSPPGP